MNLGHYLQVVADVPGIGAGPVRLFTDKETAPAEGGEIGLRITRALVFGEGEPVEVGDAVRQPADSRR